MKERDYKFYVDCKHCGRSFEIMVNGDDLKEWRNGNGLIQQRMPYLTPGERELIMNQVCDECWDEMMIEWDYYGSMFLKYYRTQQEGNYNMVTDKEKLCEILEIDPEDYDFIQEKYKIMSKHYATEISNIDKELMVNLN